jgi:S-DNA-T family DNA segregation ATPase FtsK/SpoIIIE
LTTEVNFQAPLSRFIGPLKEYASAKRLAALERRRERRGPFGQPEKIGLAASRARPRVSSSTAEETPSVPAASEPGPPRTIPPPAAAGRQRITPSPKPGEHPRPLPSEARREESSQIRYSLPPLSLLEPPRSIDVSQSKEELYKRAAILEGKLSDFGVSGKVVAISPGPVITRFEYEPAPGIKVAQIVSLADDLALALRASRIRIAAPVPGKAVVGVEIPNARSSTVYLREILESKVFAEEESQLLMALGKTISGEPFCATLHTMPHLLIAGATGSGKSVCINAILASFLFRLTPEEVRFLMIDPKRLELSIYNGIPHLCGPVITEVKHRRGRSPGGELFPVASTALEQAVAWMEQRYRDFAREGARDIQSYNARMRENGRSPKPYIIIVIDELADLIITAPKEIEDNLARLAQMSRAVGIHLILATQRPSVDVITGVIKANFPSRIAFQVVSKTDSRTILDLNGAEKLLGRGDMLFLLPGQPEPHRIHGALISTEETQRIVDFWKQQHPASPLEEEEALVEVKAAKELEDAEGGRDELFEDAKRLVIRHQQASVSLLQRRLKGKDGQGIGYARAARLIDQLEDGGIIGPFDGSKAREVLISRDETAGDTEHQ